MRCFALFYILTAISVTTISCQSSESPDNLDPESSESLIKDGIGSIWVHNSQVNQITPVSSVPVPEDSLTLASELGEDDVTDNDGSPLDPAIIVAADENAPLRPDCNGVHTNGKLRIRDTDELCTQMDQVQIQTTPGTVRKNKTPTIRIKDDSRELSPLPPRAGRNSKKADEKNRRCRGHEPFIVNTCCPESLDEPNTWQGSYWYPLVWHCRPCSRSSHTTFSFLLVPDRLL